LPGIGDIEERAKRGSRKAAPNLRGMPLIGGSCEKFLLVQRFRHV
jgi:hypothetical protein